MGDTSDKVDKAYEGRRVAELADAPVGALQGVKRVRCRALKAAFNITTVRDLGTTSSSSGLSVIT